MTIQEIHDGLNSVGYISTREIDFAVLSAINGTPLLIEGMPGCGKTQIAKSLSQMLNCPLFRISFYDGITADKILYDYDYQRQLLTIQSIQESVKRELGDKSINDSIEALRDVNFYGEQFLIKRPVLQALTHNGPCVLLLDEIDKASEENEHVLLEVLDDFAITIPQLGTIKAATKPIVILTSNNYRSLSDALKRRCNFLFIENKSADEMFNIIMKKATVSPTLAHGIAECVTSLQKIGLKQTPSIDEAIRWATYIQNNFGDDYKDKIEYSLCALVKNKDDLKTVKNSAAFRALKS